MDEYELALSEIVDQYCDNNPEHKFKESDLYEALRLSAVELDGKAMIRGKK